MINTWKTAYISTVLWMASSSHHSNQITDRENPRVISSIVYQLLTHWGRVTHICIGNLNIIGSDNGLSPGRRQAIIRSNDGIMVIGPVGTDVKEIIIEIHILSFRKLQEISALVCYSLFGAARFWDICRHIDDPTLATMPPQNCKHVMAGKLGKWLGCLT